jgi:general secretion pathway protein I
VTNEAGFSLLETLIALAILTMTGATAAQLFAASSGRSAQDLARFRAVIAAESLVERAGLDVPLEALQEGSAPGGVRWRLATAPYAEPDRGQAYEPIGLMRIEALVEPGSGGAPIRLQALHVSGLRRPR